jgi:hypothetical protein
MLFVFITKIKRRQIKTIFRIHVKEPTLSKIKISINLTEKKGAPIEPKYSDIDGSESEKGVSMCY